MASDSLDRFNKRKRLKKSITVCDSAVKDSTVNEFLNSDCDDEKVNSVYKKTEEFYDISVSQNEAEEFLIKFKKDFNQARFDQLISDCKKDVINSIVTPFGIGHIVAAYDKTGGNVTTNHNFKEGVTATGADQQKYEEWQNSVNNKVDRTVHDEVKDKWKKDTYQSMQNGEKVTDGYTGKTLGEKNGTRIDKDVSIHGEHITSVAEIEKDSKNHLFADGNTASERLQDRANLSGDEKNLTLIEGGMNSSKNDADLKEWANSKVSKKHAKEMGNPDMTNAEYYELDEQKIQEQYNKSKKYIRKTQVKKQVMKQGKELLSTGASEGTKMGMQQALGLVITEFFTAVFDEIIDIYKNGYSTDFEDDRFFSVLKDRLKRIAVRIKDKWKDAAMAFKDGFISGFISNLVTVVINAFVTTGKRVVRIIREGIYSLFKAAKVLLFPPENMTYEEALHEAKKLLATGLIVSLGVIAEEYIDVLIKGTTVLEPFSDILTTIFVGAITGLAITMTVYHIDKKKNDKDAVKLLMKQTDESFDNIDSMLNSIRKIGDNESPNLIVQPLYLKS